jgi:L-alanine-DL-glutamate epimerase-like enolase superfamily enzyme
MRIAEIALHRLCVPLQQAFVHAAGSRAASELALVELVDDAGLRGWGEVLPRAYVTGETLDDVFERHGPRIAASWLGREFAERLEVLAFVGAEIDDGALATFGGFELALLDLAGQRLGFALADVLGGMQRPELPAGVIIGFEIPTEKLERHCAALRFGKRRHVKIKVGLPDDEARMTIVAGVFGDLPVRIDANAAWTADEAIARLSALARFPISSVEQPVAKDDLAGMARIRRELGMKVMADESCCTLADARSLLAAHAADVFNVRLGKMGGVVAAARICELARDAGIEVSLGTMVGETGVLSRASEVFGRCVPGFDCLDGKGQNRHLLAEDVLAPTPDSPRDDAPGSGVRVDIDRVHALSVREPLVFTPSRPFQHHQGQP